MSGAVAAGDASSRSLDLAAVKKAYPKAGADPVTVLARVDLKATGKQLISLVGPSGCGKSTLFRLLLGMESPTSGTITVAGAAVDGTDRSRGIVFQNYSLFPHLTVLENVIFGLELDQIHFLDKYLRYPRFRRIHRAFKETGMEFLGRFRLAEHAAKYPYELSGGMRQRVAIAQAMIMKPKLLLLDEPFGALDDDIRRQCQAFLDEAFARSDMTILLVTHNIHEAVLMGDRVLVLSPFYRSESPGKVGSRIVYDVAVDAPRPRLPALETEPWFAPMVQEIRTHGLDPQTLQEPAAFRMTHPDAVR